MSAIPAVSTAHAAHEVLPTAQVSATPRPALASEPAAVVTLSAAAKQSQARVDVDHDGDSR